MKQDRAVPATVFDLEVEGVFPNRDDASSPDHRVLWASHTFDGNDLDDRTGPLQSGSHPDLAEAHPDRTLLLPQTYRSSSSSSSSSPVSSSTVIVNRSIMTSPISTPRAITQISPLTVRSEIKVKLSFLVEAVRFHCVSRLVKLQITKLLAHCLSALTQETVVAIIVADHLVVQEAEIVVMRVG